jgi:hypothetical protein
MDNVINLKMMSHPINWLLIWVALLVAGFAWKEVHQGLSDRSCGCNDIPD